MVKAVLEGSVHGVVVQARMWRSSLSFKKSGRLDFIVLNIAVTEVSVTSR